MPPKSKKQITKELSEKVSQYKELDDMLRSLRETIEECQNSAKAGDDYHDYLNDIDSREPDYTPAVNKSKEILKKYGQELYDQMESFFAGPKAADDTSVAEWVNNNYLVARLMTSSDFLNNDPVEGLTFAESRLHRAAQMAKLFLLKHLPKPDSIYWANDPSVPQSEQNYKKYMAEDFKDHPKWRKAYEKDRSLAWVKNKLASVVKINTKKKPEAKVQNAAAAKKSVKADTLSASEKEPKDAITEQKPAERKRDRQTFIKDCNNVQAKYAEIKKLLADAEAAQYTADPGNPDEAYLKIYDKYSETLWDQYEDFYKGPEKFNKDSLLDWIDRNTVTIALLSDENFRDKIKSKNPSFTDRSFGTSRTYTLCSMATNLLEAYKNEDNIIKSVAEDGTELDLPKPLTLIDQNHDLLDALSSARVSFKSLEVRRKPKEAELLAVKKSFATDYSADKNVFAEFTDKLSKALTDHDSRQYTNIINAVRTFSTLDEINALPDKNETADLKKLNQRQMQTYKMFLVKEQIDKYVSHKLKDGIKENALAKIDLVEQLDKFVCGRIREMNPEPFEVGKGKTYDPANVKTASINDLTEHKAYRDHRSVMNMVQYINDKAIDLKQFCSGGELNLNESESIMQKLIDGGYLIYDGKMVPPGTTPKELMDSVTHWDIKQNGTNIDPGTSFASQNVHSWLCVFDSKADIYKPLCIEPNHTQPGAARREELTLKNAHVWKSMDQIKDKVYDLSVDLTSTEKPWSSGGDEYKKVVESLEILNAKMQDTSIFSLQPIPNSNQKKLYAKEYSYEKLANEFTDVMTAIGNYVDSHKPGALSPSQIERLEKMNELQSIYETIKLAGAKGLGKDGKPFILEQKHFDNQKAVDKICMDKIKEKGSAYYQMALIDRGFFKTIRNDIMKNRIFRNDFNRLGAEGLLKMSKESLHHKEYMSNISDTLLEDFKRHRLLEKGESASAKIKKKLETREKLSIQFSSDEKKVLKAFAFDSDSNFKPSGQDGKLTSEDYEKAARLFFSQLKSGTIQVFGRDGKPAEFANALTVLADKISHPDTDPAFFRYNLKKNAFVGKDFVFKAGEGINIDLVGFKENPAKSLTEDNFYICNNIVEQLGEMRKELNAAKSFFHSKEHKEMSEALDNIYKDFREIDLAAGNIPSQLKKAFSKLNEKAVNYISSHYKDNINDKQFDRLVVAQKIISINESLSDPNLKYADYLKQQYAKKGTLDLARYAHQLAKEDAQNAAKSGKKPDEGIKTTNKYYMDDLTRTGNPQNKHGLNERYLDLDPKKFMDKEAFKQQINGKKVHELEALLKDNLTESVKHLKLDEHKGLYARSEKAENEAELKEQLKQKKL